MFKKKKNEENITQVSKKKPLAIRLVNGFFELLFYSALVVFIAVVFLGMQSPDDTKVVGGFSMFYIETDSMASVMPRGSLIITHRKAEKDIAVGDDITFHTRIRNVVEIVTHRVTEVDTNYEDSGTIAFTTQGVDNIKEDENKVNYENYIGTVIFSVPELGIYLTYLRDNMIMAGILIVLIVSLKKAISIYLEERLKEKKNALSV